jgi:tetratricopeptide (TPR) repeat protein
MKGLLFILLFSFITIPGMAQKQDKAARADSLYGHYKNKKALKLYNEILKSEPNNLSALWHSSLLYSRIGERAEKGDRKKEYYKKAEERAERALRIDASSSEANFARAIEIGEIARTGGINDKLNAASGVKEYAVRAIHADSSNDGAWFTLGQWNYKIAKLGSAKKTFAGLFADIPKGASTEKAVKYIKKAIDLNPSYILYHYKLAQIYKDMGKSDKAIKACQTALAKPELSKNDAGYKKKCRKLTQELSG